MAKKFENGVTYFTRGVALIAVNFPEEEVKCQYCQFCRSESDLERFWCRLTNHMIFNPMAAGLPEWCPVELTGEVVGIKRKKRKENALSEYQF